MLRACPHHGFTELTQIDNFYNGLNENDQDSLNAAAGGNLFRKTNKEALHIIENKSKVRYSRNKPNISRMKTTSRENDALLLMSKFASTIKSLLGNKDKLFELAKIPLNENCSAMSLKNLPVNLGDPNKFLIPSDFLGMDGAYRCILEIKSMTAIVVHNTEINQVFYEGHSTFGANPFVPIDDLGSMMPLIMYETLSKRWIVRGERVGWFVTTDPNTMFKNANVNTTRQMFEIKTGGNSLMGGLGNMTRI
nr:probable aminotransferase TAT2 [Tanacetum cinerariifolium]